MTSSSSIVWKAKLAAETSSGDSRTVMEGENDFARYGEDISPARDGGVRKLIEVEGHGGGKPPIGSKVRVYYSGRLMTGEEFDSNVGKREPFEFEHGKGKLKLTCCSLHKETQT